VRLCVVMLAFSRTPTASCARLSYPAGSGVRSTVSGVITPQGVPPNPAVCIAETRRCKAYT
jgi:hypothetical protein